MDDVAERIESPRRGVDPVDAAAAAAAAAPGPSPSTADDDDAETTPARLFVGNVAESIDPATFRARLRSVRRRRERESRDEARRARDRAGSASSRTRRWRPSARRSRATTSAFDVPNGGGARATWTVRVSQKPKSPGDTPREDGGDGEAGKTARGPADFDASSSRSKKDEKDTKPPPEGGAPRAGDQGPPTEKNPGVKYFVGGIGNTTFETLRAHFAKFGKIMACNVVHRTDGRPRGFGFVTFEREEDAEKALLEKHEVDGKTWDVKTVQPNSFVDSRGTKGVGGAVEGDWRCRRCDNVNFKWRDVCFKCKHAPRFESGGGGGGRRAKRGRGRPAPVEGRSGASYTLVPIRPRWRGERRSLRTLPGASLRPPLPFNPRPRRLSTPTDAFELHPDIRLYRTALIGRLRTRTRTRIRIRIRIRIRSR